MAPLLNTLHDILANLVNSVTGILQITPTKMSKRNATKNLFSMVSIPFIRFILELLRARYRSEMTPELNSLYDILADLVNSMRVFLQISFTNINKEMVPGIYVLRASIPSIRSFFELVRSRNRSGMTP